MFNFMTFLHRLATVHTKLLDEKVQSLGLLMDEKEKVGKVEGNRKESVRWNLEQQIADDKTLSEAETKREAR